VKSSPVSTGSGFFGLPNSLILSLRSQKSARSVSAWLRLVCLAFRPGFGSWATLAPVPVSHLFHVCWVAWAELKRGPRICLGTAWWLNALICLAPWLDDQRSSPVPRDIDHGVRSAFRYWPLIARKSVARDEWFRIPMDARPSQTEEPTDPPMPRRFDEERYREFEALARDAGQGAPFTRCGRSWGGQSS
jgi:hypothetical protein